MKKSSLTVLFIGIGALAFVLVAVIFFKVDVGTYMGEGFVPQTGIDSQYPTSMVIMEPATREPFGFLFVRESEETKLISITIKVAGFDGRYYHIFTVCNGSSRCDYGYNISDEGFYYKVDSLMLPPEDLGFYEPGEYSVDIVAAAYYEEGDVKKRAYEQWTVPVTYVVPEGELFIAGVKSPVGEGIDRKSGLGFSLESKYKINLKDLILTVGDGEQVYRDQSDCDITESAGGLGYILNLDCASRDAEYLPAGSEVQVYFSAVDEKSNPYSDNWAFQTVEGDVEESIVPDGEDEDLNIKPDQQEEVVDKKVTDDKKVTEDKSQQTNEDANEDIVAKDGSSEVVSKAEENKEIEMEAVVGKEKVVGENEIAEETQENVIEQVMSPESGRPWMYIILAGVVAVALAAIIIIFTVGKKSKK